MKIFKWIVFGALALVAAELAYALSNATYVASGPTLLPGFVWDWITKRRTEKAQAAADHDAVVAARLADEKAKADAKAAAEN